MLSEDAFQARLIELSVAPVVRSEAGADGAVVSLAVWRGRSASCWPMAQPLVSAVVVVIGPVAPAAARTVSSPKVEAGALPALVTEYRDVVPAGAVTAPGVLRPNDPTSSVCGSVVVTDGAVAVRESRAIEPLCASNGEAPSTPR